MLQGLVDFDGYYLESDPCLVCNNPEVPYTVSIRFFDHECYHPSVLVFFGIPSLNVV